MTKTYYFSEIANFLKQRAEQYDTTENNNLSEELKQQATLWSNYPEITTEQHRRESINQCFDQIISHLTNIGTTEALLAPYQGNGLLRQHALRYAEYNNIKISMREELFYINLISELNEEERNKNLRNYPGSIPPEDYNCLDGGRDRRQNSSQELTLKKLPIAASLILSAHDELVEQARISASLKVCEGNHIHVKPALDYAITDYLDPTKNYDFTTSLEIPAEELWQNIISYVSNLNDKIVDKRDEVIKNIAQSLAQNPDPLTNPESWPTIKARLKDFRASPEMLLDEESGDWDLEKIGTNVIPPITIDAPHPQEKIAPSLFAPHFTDSIAQMVANFKNLAFNSSEIDEESRSKMLISVGSLLIKALHLLGNPNQKGSSISQFIKAIYEIGKRENIDEPSNLNVLNNGISILLELTKDLPALKSKVDQVISWYEKIHLQWIDLLPKNYCEYIIAGDGLDLRVTLGLNPTFDTLKSQNFSPKELERYFQNLDTELSNYENSGSSNLDCIFFNPDLLKILDHLVNRSRFAVPQQTAEKLGTYLTYKAAQNCNLDAIRFVHHDLKIRGKNDYEFKCYNSKKSIEEGLKLKPRFPEYCLSGIEYLAYNNANNLKEFITNDGARFYDVLPDFLNNNVGNSGKSILCLLAQRDDSTNFIRLCETYSYLDTTRLTKVFSKNSQNQNRTTTANLDFTKKFVDGNTTLHYAAASKNTAIIKYLLDNKPQININEQNELGDTPLMTAVKNGNAENVALLLAKKADYRIKNYDDESVLTTSIIADEAAVVKVLIDEVDYSQYFDGDSDKLIAYLSNFAAKAGSVEVLSLLKLKSDKALNAKNSEDQTPLMNAKDLKTFRFLVERGADLQAKNKLGANLLLSAILDQKEEIIKEILDKKFCDLEAKDHSSSTALMYAVFTNLNIFKLLLQNGANPKTTDDEGYTILHFFISRNDINNDDFSEFLQIACENGAEINAKNVNGVTPLMLAATDNSWENCKTLMEYGADHLTQDLSGRNFLHYAIESNNDEVVANILTNKLCDLDEALETALKIPSLKATKKLLEVGAKITEDKKLWRDIAVNGVLAKEVVIFLVQKKTFPLSSEAKNYLSNCVFLDQFSTRVLTDVGYNKKDIEDKDSATCARKIYQKIYNNLVDTCGEDRTILSRGLSVKDEKLIKAYSNHILGKFNKLGLSTEQELSEENLEEICSIFKDRKAMTENHSLSPEPIPKPIETCKTATPPTKKIGTTPGKG